MMWSLFIASILILHSGCVRSRECTDIFDCSSPNGFCCDNGQCCSFDDVSQQNQNQFVAIAVGITVPFVILICCCSGIAIYLKHRAVSNMVPTYVTHATAGPIATGTQYPTTVIAPPSVYNTERQGYSQQQHHPPSINQQTHKFTSSPPPYPTGEMNSAPTAPSAPPSYEESVTYPTAHIVTETK